MQARLEEDWGENTRGSSHPAPPIKQNRGKKPILLGDSDAIANDELSPGSSPLLDNLRNGLKIKVIQSRLFVMNLLWLMLIIIHGELILDLQSIF